MKVVKTILTIIVMAVFVWLVSSTIDIMVHNNPANDNFKKYTTWNIYTICKGE